MRDAAAREQPRDGRVVKVQPAGIGAEGRRQCAKTVRHEGATPTADDGDGMQVPGDLAMRLARRFVTQGERPEPHFVRAFAADGRGNFRIVVAGNPDPVAARLQRGELFEIAGAEAFGRLVVDP